MAFFSNPAKDTIRKRFDKPFVAKNHSRAGRALTYFGMPGPEILDVLEWGEFLDTIIAIERDEISSHLMRTNASRHEYSSRDFQILNGDINKILMDGKDSTDQEPIKSAFDIVNLDYVSGLLHKTKKHKSKVIKAIKSLFSLQSKESRNFTLFLTFNTRNSDEGEFDRVLNDIQEELADYGVDAGDTVDWYLESRIDYKIKVYIPYAFMPYCKTFNFTCEDMQAVSYIGTGQVRMIHLGMFMNYQYRDAGASRSGQTRRDILNMPMYSVENGSISISNSQAPEVIIN